MRSNLAVLPDEYRTADENDLIERIQARKVELGKKLLIRTIISASKLSGWGIRSEIRTAWPR